MDAREHADFDGVWSEENRRLAREEGRYVFDRLAGTAATLLDEHPAVRTLYSDTYPPAHRRLATENSNDLSLTTSERYPTASVSVKIFFAQTQDDEDVVACLIRAGDEQHLMGSQRPLRTSAPTEPRDTPNRMVA